MTIAPTARGRLISWFMPVADVTERHETLVHAPADVVFGVAQNFDMQSIPAIRAIIWLRGKLLGATPMPKRRPRGIVAESLGLGWGVLAERPGRELVAGAVAQPWTADVKFTPIAPDRFAKFAEPDLVKIVWSLEAEPLGPDLTRFRTETRAVATNTAALKKFRRYWRWARFGVGLIRWIVVPRVRREAELTSRRTRAERATRSTARLAG
jgi:hypothetical protein